MALFTDDDVFCPPRPKRAKVEDSRSKYRTDVSLIQTYRAWV